MKKIHLLCGLTLMGLVPGMVYAVTKTGTLTATASVQAVCNIANIGNIAFGIYDPVDTNPTDSTGSVGVRCTKNTPYEVYITAPRSMTGSANGDSLSFELYSDSVFGAVWGNATGSGVTNTPADNTVTTHTIYGRIAAEQDVSADTYSGDVTITVEY